MTFQEFVASSLEATFLDFIGSRIASDNGIDAGRWPNHKPESFIIFQDQYWMAKFADGTFHAAIENQEFSGSFTEVALCIYNWQLEP